MRTQSKKHMRFYKVRNCSGLSGKAVKTVVISESERRRCLGKEKISQHDNIWRTWQRENLIGNILQVTDSEGKYFKFNSWSYLGFKCYKRLRDCQTSIDYLPALSTCMQCSCPKEINKRPEKCDMEGTSGWGFNDRVAYDRGNITMCEDSQSKSCKCIPGFAVCNIVPHAELRCTACVSDNLGATLRKYGCSKSTENSSSIDINKININKSQKNDTSTTNKNDNNFIITLTAGISYGILILVAIAVAIVIKKGTNTQVKRFESNQTYGVYAETYAATEMADRNSDY